jgi:GTP cyclohydrolase II
VQLDYARQDYRGLTKSRPSPALFMAASTPRTSIYSLGRNLFLWPLIDWKSLSLLAMSGNMPEGLLDGLTQWAIESFRLRQLDKRIVSMSVNSSIISETAVERVAEANLPTEFGLFKIIGFRNLATGEEIVALVKGDVTGGEHVLVRLHSQCLTGDVFYSVKCDCGRQLHQAMKLIDEEGSGAIVYQPQEGRGIGLLNKIRAYALQDEGLDTVEANLSLGFEADLRQYEDCAEVIKNLGIKSVRLLSNNPDKIAALRAADVDVSERVSLEVEADASTLNYLKTKKEKLGHLLKNIA